uniref:myb-like protein P n=1 Tax=Erigeron canadensis TaxID=72917 RepID=UPI001CB9CBBE|nr:myb-like protein P [Erigeron canadensis]
MGWKRWMAGFLGFGNHESNHNDNHIHNDPNNNSDIDHHQQQEEELEEEVNHNYNNNASNYIKSNRKGFSVPVQQIGPVFLPCRPGDGGLQGLGWYTKRLRVDEDGDVAEEFFDEVFAETTSSTEAHHKHYPKFEVKVNTKSAKARNPVLSREGTIQQVVEYRGRFLLV